MLNIQIQPKRKKKSLNLFLPSIQYHFPFFQIFIQSHYIRWFMFQILAFFRHFWHLQCWFSCKPFNIERWYQNLTRDIFYADSEYLFIILPYFQKMSPFFFIEFKRGCLRVSLLGAVKYHLWAIIYTQLVFFSIWIFSHFSIFGLFSNGCE